MAKLTLIVRFFFFQAEDGIRDLTVTGVQTCALPICSARPGSNIKITEGRMFQPGLAELVVGKNASSTYSGLKLGNTIGLGSTRWQVEIGRASCRERV